MLIAATDVKSVKEPHFRTLIDFLLSTSATDYQRGKRETSVIDPRHLKRGKGPKIESNPKRKIFLS